MEVDQNLTCKMVETCLDNIVSWDCMSSKEGRKKPESQEGRDMPK